MTLKSKYSNKISNFKFILLSLVTFGIYELYWFYKNWKSIKEKKRLNIRPFWRSFFAIFFVYSLFKYIIGIAKEKGYKEKISVGWMAFFWIIGAYFLWRLPDPYWLISMLTFLPLLPLLNAMNFYWSKTEGNLQSRKFNWWQLILIVFGVLFFILAIVGSFIPVE